MQRPSEATAFHTRLLKCSLEVEHCRAYWLHIAVGANDSTAQVAFEEVLVWGEEFAACHSADQRLQASL